MKVVMDIVDIMNMDIIILMELHCVYDDIMLLIDNV